MKDGSRSPISILFCINTLSPSGGTEGQLAGLIERLDRSRFLPHLCTLRPEIPVRDLPYDCPHLKLNVPRLFSFNTILASRRLARYLREHRIQVVQTFFQDATVFGTWTARLAGVPVRLISFRDLGFWRTRRLEFLMRRTYGLASGFVVNSAAVRDHFQQADGLPIDRFHVIHNGLDPGRILYCPDETEPPRVVLVGNLNRHVKRPDIFVRAAALAHARCPQARWQLVGDGKLRGQLEQLARDLHVAECVDFLGRLDNIGAVLAGASVGVNCSDSEGFSNALLEYMMAGCAVVATAVGGNKELICDGIEGRLVPVGDAAALAAGVTELLNAPGRARAMKDSARQRVEQEFTWDRCTERSQALYESLLSEAMVASRGA